MSIIIQPVCILLNNIAMRTEEEGALLNTFSGLGPGSAIYIYIYGEGGR